MRSRLLLLLFPILLLAPGRTRAEGPSTDEHVSTPEEAFAAMRHSFQPAKAKGLHVRYQFYFKAPQAGTWCVAVDDGTCVIRRGEIPHPDATFECTGADWVEMCNGTLGGFHAWVTGRMRMQGSQAAARKMDDLFP